MTTLWNGTYTPDNEDMWNLVGDMRKQGLSNNRIIPVYSKGERDSLADAAPASGIPEGTVVLRMDQSARGAVFDVFLDGKWMEGDTGVLTSGVGLQPSGVTTIESYSFRRRGTTVTARVDMKYTGATVTGRMGDGNLSPNIHMFNVGEEWKPIWTTFDVTITRPGAAQHFGVISDAGRVELSNTLPGHVLNAETVLRFDGSWQVP